MRFPRADPVKAQSVVTRNRGVERLLMSRTLRKLGGGIIMSYALLGDADWDSRLAQ